MSGTNHPGVLAIMGSGETSPTMVTVHRALAARLAPGARAVLLDTPYAFQENVSDISAKAVAYFRRSVGLGVEVCPAPDGGDPATSLAAIAAIRTADWLFAGPGSPTYALTRWTNGTTAAALRDRIRHRRGLTVFASAAAATMGRTALPVYEIYKAGLAPHWVEGLNMLEPLGLDVTVIPHFDNTEGGTHDTRYCYLGERRLTHLERRLPQDTALLGVDEHTAVIVDQHADAVEIMGRGALTVRRAGVSTVLPAGTTLTLAELRALTRHGPSVVDLIRAVPTEVTEPGNTPVTLVEITRVSEAAFASAHTDRDARGMVEAVLSLEAAITEWASDTEEDEGTGQSRAILRDLITRLGDTVTPDALHHLRPAVEPLLALRRHLRDQGAYPHADAIRDALAAAGLNLRDAPEATQWSLGGVPGPRDPASHDRAAGT
ncbi:CysS/YqeB C-terminal domain-containing protein [Longispora urticae]